MPDKGLPSLWSDPLFWGVVVGATLFKAATSPALGGWPLAVSAFAGLFCGAFFAPEIVGLFDGKYPFLITAATVLSGEHAMRIVIEVATDPAKGLDLLKKWRGGGNAQ